MPFEFATATRVVFGIGTAAQLPGLCRAFSTRVLAVTGGRVERHAVLLEKLRAAGLEVHTFSIRGEPTADEARTGAEMARRLRIGLVLGLGGGSAVDAGKAIAALACQPADLFEYLEVVGKGRALDEKPLPFIAMPTTAGTGAEVTRNAVLASPAHGVKASLRHASMLPAVALVDPALAIDCPPAITAASGMDALTQCLEAFVSCKAQPMTDALCVEGIRRAARALPRAVANGQDLEAREDMALAALFSGMALANAGLGAVHGFAAPLGGSFHAPHGAVCAALLAPVWALNASRVAGTPLAAKFATAASLLTGKPGATVEAGTAMLRGLTRTLRIPGLGAHGITEDRLDDIAAKAAQASSMKGNPVPLDHASLVALLREAL